MKKLLALLMVLAMTVACFASCGSKDDSTGDSTSPSQSTGDSQSAGGDTSFPTDGRVYNDFKVGGQAIIGSSTELSGDFRWPGRPQAQPIRILQNLRRVTLLWT